MNPRAEFRRQHPAGDETDHAAANRRPRVLVVTPYSIHPQIHGGAVRIGNLIRRMASWCDVSLMVLSGGTDDPEQRLAYQQWCEHVFIQHLSPTTVRDPDPWKLLPPAAAKYSAPCVADRIAALVDAHNFDIVHLEYSELGAYVGRCGAASSVLIEHDLGFRTQSRQRNLGFGRRFNAADRVGVDANDGLRQERFEILACETADQVHLMSDVDLQILASRLTDPSHLRVIPNGVDTSLLQPSTDHNRRGALFLGSFPHLPNLDAFEFLMEEIWPRIRRLQPDARLTVAGARPPESVLSWNDRNGIRVVGEVDEVAPLYQQHRVLVVPLRAGSGTRLKILEAMSCGLPVVSTTIGAEGLPLSEQPEIVIADHPESIAREVSALLVADEAQVTELGERERRLVKANFDWDAVAQRLRTAHSELMARDRRARPLTVVATDSASSDSPSEISIIIPISGPTGITPDLIHGLVQQRCSRKFEMICVAHDSDPGLFDRWRAAGGRVVTVRGPKPNQGAMLNAGANAATGRILVFTSSDAVPSNERWLQRLTGSLIHPYAPAAIQGGITIHRAYNFRLSDLGFTRTSKNSDRGYGGIDFSVINSAMRRDIWEIFPFPPNEIAADRQWQRLAHESKLLILKKSRARVRLVPPSSPAALVPASRAEDRSWRRVAKMYSVLGAASDLLQTGPPPDAGEGKAPRLTTRQRFTNRIRSVGLFIVNRLRGS